MYKVYGAVASRAFRVMWALDEIGQDYEVIPAKAHSEEMLAVNPSGKVPALVDGATALTDSTAIITYLADKHGKLTYPAGTIERAHQDALMHTFLDEFDAVLWAAMRLSSKVPDDLKVPQAVAALHWEFARNLERMGKRFVGPFLQGDEMTVADIVATHCLNWAAGARFPLENQTMRDYAHAMSARDAYKKARAHSV